MKEIKQPPLVQQLNHYKEMYMKYFYKCVELEAKCIEVKHKHIDLKVEIATLKLELEKRNLPFLGTIS